MSTETYTQNEITPGPVTRNPADNINAKLNALHLWMRILNARLLAGVALLGALIGFAFCMYDPVTPRLWGLAIYCTLCLWPIIGLFLRKG